MVRFKNTKLDCRRKQKEYTYAEIWVIKFLLDCRVPAILLTFNHYHFNVWD